MELHLAHKKKVEENRRKLAEMGILPEIKVLQRPDYPAKLLFQCPYCPRKFKRHPLFEDHVWHHESKFGYWNDGSPFATNIGKCAACGTFVIAPNRGVNYGSIYRLVLDGFTGDIDPATSRLYCFNCMKKVGWQWGEKEEKEADEE